MAAGETSNITTKNPIKIFANIFIAFIGAGVLGLPYAFKESGILEGAVIMSLVGAVSVKAMLMLVDCKYKIISTQKKHLDSNRKGEAVEDGLLESSINDSALADEVHMLTRMKHPNVSANVDLSYGDVGYEAIGSAGRLLVDFAVVTSQIGFCCAYLIFICRNLSDFVPTVDMSQWLLMILPPLSLLTLLRHLNSLAFTSMMAQCSNLFAFGVVFWFDFEHLHNVSIHPKEVSLENVPFFFVIAIYCYEGAGLILSLEGSLATEVRHKFTKYFITTMVIVTSLYISFGSCGYLSFGQETNQIITLNLPKGLGLDFSLLVKSFLCIALFCTYPVMMFPVMKILEHYFLPDASNSLWKGNVLRGLVVLLTGVVVMVIPNFADLMALVGASCCTLLAFILPGIFHMYLFKGELTKTEFYFDWFLVALGICGTILGLWDAFSRVGSEAVQEVATVSNANLLSHDVLKNISQTIKFSTKALLESSTSASVNVKSSPVNLSISSNNG